MGGLILGVLVAFYVAGLYWAVRRGDPKEPGGLVWLAASFALALVSAGHILAVILDRLFP